MCRSKRAGVLGVVLALMLCPGCGGPLSPQARQLLRAGYDVFEKGDYAAAIEKLSTFLRDNAGSSRADEAYYLRGLAKRRTDDPGGAKDDLNSAIAATQNKELRAKALVALGDLAYEGDDMALAENMYRQALADIERGQKPSDHAHYRLGTVLQRQGRWTEADVQFDRVVYLFGDSQLARLAARRTHCTAWTIQAGAYADKRRADLAAKRLRDKKLPAVSRATLRDGKPLFLVLVGRFASYEQAAAALGRTKERRPDAFIVTTR